MLVNDAIFGAELLGEPLIRLGEPFRSAHHRPDFVKIFLDGIPPTRNRGVLEPYLPDDVHGAHHRRQVTMDPEELGGWLLRTARQALSAKIHCTGDAAVRAALDAMTVTLSAAKAMDLDDVAGVPSSSADFEGQLLTRVGR